MGLSRAWAFSGQAIDAVGDAHLAPGVHYRVLTNPLLGLPVVPLVIGKVELGEARQGLHPPRRHLGRLARHDPHDAVHRHARQPGHRLPARGRDLLLGRPRGPREPDRLVSVPVPGPAARRGRTAHEDGAPESGRGAAGPGAVRPVTVKPAAHAGEPGRGPIDIRERLRGCAARFWVEGVVATAHWRRAGGDPQQRALPRLRLPPRANRRPWQRHGHRTVVAARRAPSTRRSRSGPHRSRRSPGPATPGPSDGRDQGFDRVERGAPQRFGMHESAARGRTHRVHAGVPCRRGHRASTS